MLFRSLARLCGLNSATLRQGQEENFYNGRPLRDNQFLEPLKDGTSAVFGADKNFLGAVEKSGGRARYEFVVSRENLGRAGR